MSEFAADQYSATHALAEYVAQPPGQVPAEGIELVRTAVLDTVGVALAAACEPAVSILRGALTGDMGTHTPWADGRVDPVRAALLNGTAAHALDFDDVDDLLTGHPSAVLVPAVLAAAERTKCSGALAVEGYWRGLVVMRALAAGLVVGEHYARGWHSSTTLGTIGATAATATVLGLDEERARQALGVAVSRAAGSRQNFGSMTKPLHAGLAASDGVLAAILAESGFTAGPDPIGGAYGFLSLYAGDGAPTEAERCAATKRIIDTLRDPGPAALNVKLHPCCYATNAAADASLELRERGLCFEDIEDVRIDVPPAGLQPLNESVPRTGLEGKFNLAYVVASCLVDGRLGLGAFTDEAVRRTTIRDLAARITATETLAAPSVGRLIFAARVTVRTRSGVIESVHRDAPRGHANSPAPIAEIQAKFDDCVAFGAVDVPADLAARLRAIPESPTVAGMFARQ